MCELTEPTARLRWWPDRSFLVHLALTTGLRIGEMDKLRFDWFNFDEGKLHVYRLKRGQSLEDQGIRLAERRDMSGELFALVPMTHCYVPSGGEFQEHVESYRELFATEPDGRVFPDNKKRSLQYWWEDALKMANIPKCGIHSARHTLGVMMAARGRHILQIKEQLGHSSITSTEIYAQPLPHQMPKAVDVWDQ